MKTKGQKYFNVTPKTTPDSKNRPSPITVLVIANLLLWAMNAAGIDVSCWFLLAPIWVPVVYGAWHVGKLILRESL